MPLSAARPSNLEWLRKTAKQTLKQLRAGEDRPPGSPTPSRARADFGFDSWRRLKRHVEEGEGEEPRVSRRLLRSSPATT